MTTSTILSDNGVTSGTSGLKTSGGNDGTLILQTTTSGGAATTALTIDTSQNSTFVGSASATKLIPTGGTATGNGMYLPAANTLAWSTNGAEGMRLDSSGNLGIGVTPSTNTIGKLLQLPANGQVITNGDGYFTSNAVYNSGWTYVGTGPAAFVAFNSGAIVFDNAASGTAGNAITFTERARINASGYFKASDTGTYTDATGTENEFRQSVDSVTLRLTNTSASLATAGTCFIDVSRNTTNATFYAFSYYNRGAAAYKFRIADSGTATNATGTYTTISDIKLKQDIVDAKSQWNDIKSLRIVNYRLKEYVQADPNAKPFIGLIAQEVEKVCPSLIEEQEDEVPGEDGKLVKNGEVTKGVKTSILYMKAVKALQEAMERIETLEAQNAAFEARLAALESK